MICGEIMTMALIGLSSAKSTWNDLIKMHSLRDRPLWTSELENLLTEMLGGRSLSSERQVFSPFIARNRIRYLPVLGRMELVGGVPSSISLILIEMSAFWADPFQMSLRGVPPR